MMTNCNKFCGMQRTLCSTAGLVDFAIRLRILGGIGNLSCRLKYFTREMLEG